jgi:hypothetical protein
VNAGRTIQASIATLAVRTIETMAVEECVRGRFVAVPATRGGIVGVEAGLSTRPLVSRITLPANQRRDDRTSVLRVRPATALST